MARSRRKSDIVLHKMVYEMRYEYGHTYLDKCGITVRELLADSPGWFFRGAQSQGAGVISNPDLSRTFTFGLAKLDLSQEQTRDHPRLQETEKFFGIADSFTDVVVRQLDISIVTRVGFRTWNMLECKSPDEVQEMIKGLKVVSPEACADFGEDVEQVSFTCVVDRGSHKARIAAVSAEQTVHIDYATMAQAQVAPHKLPTDQRKALFKKLKAKKALKNFPQYFVMVDIDYFIEYPPWPDVPRIFDFLKERFDENLSLVGKILDLQN